MRVVINPQMIDVWQQADQVFTAAPPTLADFLLGNVVPAAVAAPPHAFQVQLGTAETQKRRHAMDDRHARLFQADR